MPTLNFFSHSGVSLMLRCLLDRRAVSSMEYAILAAVVLVTVAAGANVLSGDIAALFAKVHTVIAGVTG